MSSRDRTELGNVEIPQEPGTIYTVCCPAQRFALRGVQSCPGCEHFDALLDQQRPRPEGAPEAPEQPFIARYRVICRFPISREIHAVQVN